MGRGGARACAGQGAAPSSPLPDLLFPPSPGSADAHLASCAQGMDAVAAEESDDEPKRKKRKKKKTTQPDTDSENDDALDLRKVDPPLPVRPESSLALCTTATTCMTLTLP